MKILLTGANGQVGHEIQRETFPSQIELIALTREFLDITQFDNVVKVFKQYQPDLIINSAAYTAVDRSEIDQVQAHLVNSEGASHLAKACNEFNIPLIHLSTDYVFDGKAHIPYTESDKTEPLGIYGQSKWMGEEAIRSQLKKHIILRTSWVFGHEGNNFVKTILKLAKDRPILRIVKDQIGGPTSAKDIAVTIWKIINKMEDSQDFHWGTYHYTGVPAVSWYEFAQTILQYASLTNELTPITTEEYPTLAQRPAYSILNCEKIENAFGIKQPQWETELLTLIKDLI